MSKVNISSDELTPTTTFDPDTLANPINPDWFRGVHEARLAKEVGIDQFGVNKVTLDPGSYSALRHWHEGEDEFILILNGELTLIEDTGEHVLHQGSTVGFPAGVPNAHHLANRSAYPATYLAVGTRLPAKDVIHYPDNNLKPVTR
ncbi:MAG: cupin domain-containing protein [Pseudomonadales bacterium]|nr:cupin domain-containing protein [Pseudomonadales bacterium]